jgi:hypothetical protein
MAKFNMQKLIHPATLLPPSGPTGPGSGPLPQSFHMVKAFHKDSADLRREFEDCIVASQHQHGGLTPLKYAFCPNAYQFLTAAAEQIFSSQTLDQLIQALLVWSTGTLGTTHVSTPQLRVYVGDCFRNVLRDDFEAPWHYLLALSKGHGPNRSSLRFVKDRGVHNFSRLTTVHLGFNDLVVYPTKTAYGIDRDKTRDLMATSEVFLDGYFW